MAQTGTGKTAAFSLPILNQIKNKGLQAIVLCPTRELCLQLTQDIKNFTSEMKDISTVAVYGGEKIDFQIRSLKGNVNIVVGTPGRVHDLIRRQVLKLNSIKWLVLDEADEMLDMGFKADLDAILGETPESRQTLLFSATISHKVQSIAKNYMSEAIEISVGEKNIGASKVSHEYYLVSPRDRFQALRRILDNLPGVYGILFCRTRRETQDIADKLKKAHYDAEPLHGDISQSIRTKIMDRFKQKQIKLLVATDVAARGIDVSDLTHVINYNLPDQSEAYTHRSGRTGRAEKSGVSISILVPRDSRRIRELENTIGKKFELKKVPSGEDICVKQIECLLNEIMQGEVNEANEKYLDMATERLKKVKKEDLIKHLLNEKISHLLEAHKDNYDLNAKPGRDNAKPGKERSRKEIDGVNLKMNLGKNNGLDVKSLFSIINSNRKLKGVELGKISIMGAYTIFSVEKRRASQAVMALNNTRVRGQKLIVSQAGSAMASSSGPRTSRSYKGRGQRKYKGR